MTQSEIIKTVLKTVNVDVLKDAIKEGKSTAYKLVVYFSVDHLEEENTVFSNKLWRLDDNGFESESIFLSSTSLKITEDERNDLFRNDESGQIEEVLQEFVKDNVGKIKSCGVIRKSSIQSGNYIFKFEV